MIKLYPFDCTDKKLWEYENIEYFIKQYMDDKNSNILSLGAGSEPVAYRLYLSGYTRINHTDISIMALENFKERFLIKNNISNKISVTNADMITFKGISDKELFDCIYHISSIEHFTMDRINLCLTNCSKHLKYGGYHIFTADVLYLYPEEIVEDNYLHIEKIKEIIKECEALSVEHAESYTKKNKSFFGFIVRIKLCFLLSFHFVFWLYFEAHSEKD